MQTKNAEFRQLLNEVVNDGDDRIESEGYSSVEISEPKTEVEQIVESALHLSTGSRQKPCR